MPFSCPVCGYPELQESPYSTVTGGGSDEICPSCGIHFGYEDHAGGDPVRRLELYKTRRQKWIADGMPWHSRGRSRPPGWNPIAQLRHATEHPKSG